MRRYLPISTDSFFDFLQKEKVRVLKNIERSPSAKAKVEIIKETEVESVLSMKMDKPLRTLGIREGDFLELGDSKLIGILSNQRDLYNFDVIFEKKRDVKVGSRLSVRKAHSLILIELQEKAMKQFIDNPMYHYSILREVVLRGKTMQPKEKTFVSKERSFFSDLELNESQKEAVTNALFLSHRNPFLLIHGPPGTGKTRTIAELITQIASNNQRVLLTSHTNIAVDGALEVLIRNHPKLKDEIIRFGNPGKVLSTVTDLLPRAKDGKRFISNELKTFQIVGMTLSRLSLKVYHDKLSWSLPSYDWIIVDESANTTLPQVLMGLMLSPRSVLVGDHMQLPPIIVSKANLEVHESLFEKLIRSYPDRGVMLNIQYRSNEKIAKWPSYYIYNSKLKTANSVKNLKLELHSSVEDEFSAILGSEPVIWVDTKEKSKQEKWFYGYGKSLCNDYEAALTIKIAKNILELLDLQNVSNKEELLDHLGVICPFRLQAAIMHSINAKTVDSFQGRESDTVIFNTVATNPHIALKDIRKLNVAITRARKKLIIIGSSSLCTSQLPHYLSFYNYIKQQCKIVNSHSISNLGMDEVRDEKKRILNLSRKPEPKIRLRPYRTKIPRRYVVKEEKQRRYSEFIDLLNQVKTKGKISPAQWREHSSQWSELPQERKNELIQQLKTQLKEK